MDNTIKKDALLLRILFFFRYFGDALFYSFFQLFLVSRGFDEAQIGLVIAITPIISIAFNPFWNYLSKDANINLKIMKFITVIEGILIIIIGNLTSFEIIIVITGVIAIVGSPFYSLFDGFTATFTEENKLEYSRFRKIGSLSYIFGCSLGGLLIGLWGYTIVFIISGSIFVACNIFIRFIKPIPLKEKDRPKRDFKAVLTNKNFILYVIFYITTVSIATVGDNFLGVYLNKVRGITDSQYGQIVAVWVVVEFITMIFLDKIGNRFKDYQILTVMGLVYFLRLLAVGLSMPTYVLIALAITRGIAMGSLLHIHLKHLGKIIGYENLTIGILLIAIVSSFVLALGSACGGYAIKIMGYNMFFIILFCIVLLSTIIYCICGIIYNRNKKELLVRETNI